MRKYINWFDNFVAPRTRGKSCVCGGSRSATKFEATQKISFLFCCIIAITSWGFIANHIGLALLPLQLRWCCCPSCCCSCCRRRCCHCCLCWPCWLLPLHTTAAAAATVAPAAGQLPGSRYGYWCYCRCSVASGCWCSWTIAAEAAATAATARHCFSCPCCCPRGRDASVVATTADLIVAAAVLTSTTLVGAGCCDWERLI